MYASKIILALAASTLSSASAVFLAERMPLGAISERATMQGWSLQSTSAQSSLVSCGKNSYCPTGLTCNTAASAEVAACCTSGDCRGDVEGAPKCADSSWNLFKGYNGNGFCCLVGQVGVYDSSSNVAGSCVASASSGQQVAVQMSTGSGSAATTSAASVSSAVSSASTSAAAAVASVSSSAASRASSATASASSTGAASGMSSGTGSSITAPTLVPVVSTNSTILTAPSSMVSNSASAAAATNGSSTASATAAAKTGAASAMQAGVLGAVGGLVLAFAL